MGKKCLNELPTIISKGQLSLFQNINVKMLVILCKKNPGTLALRS
jgi:hypothetical protein